LVDWVVVVGAVLFHCFTRVCVKGRGEGDGRRERVCAGCVVGVE
jgi:hypothetical protein